MSPIPCEDKATLNYLWPFIAVVLMQLAGGLLPGRFTWGFDYWGLFGSPYRYLFPALALVLLFPPVLNPLTRIFSRLLQFPLFRERWLHPAAGIILGSIILFSIFYFFRSQAHFYGDGYSVLALTSAGKLTFSGQYQLQMLSVIVHHLSYLSMSKLAPLSAEQIFAATNCLGGVIGFWAIVRLAFLLAARPAARSFLILGACTSGAVLLFFGYIENYTWASAAGLWTMAFLVTYARTGKDLLPAVACGIAATLFHIVATPFLLAVFAVILWRIGHNRKLSFSVQPKHLTIAAIGGSFLIALIIQLTGRQYLLVPLWPTAGNHYWSFSPSHLADLLNHLFLMAPLGIMLLVGAILTSKRRPMEPEEMVLAIAALFAFLAAFWIDPLIGMVRDWDLLSLYGIPLSLWGCYRFSRLFSGGEAMPVWLLPVTIVLLVCLAPNIYEKNHPQAALQRLDRLIYDDPHYQADYDNAYRAVSWGMLLDNALDRSDLAEKYFRRRLTVAPDSPVPWFNLGNSLVVRHAYDSAAYCFRQAVTYKPDYALAWCQLIRAEAGLGRLERAFQEARRGASLNPGSTIVQASIGNILLALQQYGEAVAPLRTALTLESSPSTALSLGGAYYQLSQPDSACRYLMLAHSVDPGRLQVYDPLIQVLIHLQRYAEAEDLLNQYERLAPRASSIPTYRKVITERTQP